MFLVDIFCSWPLQTLLNTVTNLGGNWPSTLALWLVDPLSSKECRGSNSTLSLTAGCGDSVALEQCGQAGGQCVTTVDGYYVECGLCFIIG